MTGNFYKISFWVKEQERKDILVALLADSGYQGFQEESGVLHAFIEEEDFDENLLADLQCNYELDWQKSAIPQQNWNASWENSFQPVQVGDFCRVRAAFHAPANGAKHEIVITPRMSFGTGHHATTFLMIELMEALDFADKDVLDFGTGTGVLAILAEKLGAKRVVAIDHDPWSIENATQNLLENHSQRIELLHGDDIKELGAFDIILANISRNVLLETMPAFGKQLFGGEGVVIMSGLLENDRQNVLEKAMKYDLELRSQKTREGWLAMVFTHG